MQSAQVAAKALDGLCPIEIIDSQSASMGIGNLALHAARRAREGADVATIAREVNDRRERQQLFAALDTLEYLRKGGRIGGAQAMLGSMLSIKPIITVIDGAVEQAGQGPHPLEGAAASCSTRSPEARSSRSACCTRARPTSTSSSTLVQPEGPRRRDRRRARSGRSSACTSVRAPSAVAWIERDG